MNEEKGVLTKTSQFNRPSSSKRAFPNNTNFKKPHYELEDEVYTEEDRPWLRRDERTVNALSRFYLIHKPIILPEDTESWIVKQQLGLYTHSDAIDFAAETRIWSRLGRSTERAMKREKFDEYFPTFLAPGGIKAYYRLIADKEDKYIFVACHVNVHGFHRGDLRFVEVNDQTIVDGFGGRSVMGNLLMGDIVAVTELRKTSDEPLKPPGVFRVNQDKKCIWAVHKMTVLKRHTRSDLLFAFLHNGTAVVKAFDEVMAVKPKVPKMKLGQLYRGHAFVPDHVEYAYTLDTKEAKAVEAKCASIPAFSNAIGTIMSYRHDKGTTDLFEVGVKAFKEDAYGCTDPDASDIVETCALIGYSAANAVLNGRFDDRKFQMLNPKKEGLVVKFSILNPYKDPTENRWMSNMRIRIDGKHGKDDKSVQLNALIETVVTDESGKQLNISARLSRASPKDVSFKHHIPFMVSQREPLGGSALSEDFFTELDDSNGKDIIKTLYGGAPLKIRGSFDERTFTFPSTPAVRLNECQNEYVSMLTSQMTPLVLASSPFGCGKSMTIVTAALEMHRIALEYDDDDEDADSPPMQLLVTQSNYASVNLVDIARKCAKSLNNVKFVRFVSEANWKELPDNCRTEYDLPMLIRTFFVKIVLEELPSKTGRQENYGHYATATRFVISEGLVQPHELSGKALKIYQTFHKNDKGEITPARNVIETFFALYKPDIIMTTADSLQGLITMGVLSNVRSIQIDEASQVPEYTFLSLFTKFPNAVFGMIGDIQQLPPYCTEELTGKLKDYGVGNTMERAINGKMFPQAILRYVYRCHPETTDLLSDLFYDGQLISGVTEEDRDEFMYEMTFWPNPDYPMIIVDNQEPGYKMGTSCANKAEVTLVKQIVDYITKAKDGYCIRPEDVGVISFYSAQTSVLTEAMRESGVKCGTVDAFQGSEREVIIVCCTNERISEFMQLSNRLNVAMSRARQATIVIGNIEGMRNAKYWSTIVQRAENFDCIVDTEEFPFCIPIAEKKAQVEKVSLEFEKLEIEQKYETKSTDKLTGGKCKKLEKIKDVELCEKQKKNAESTDKIISEIYKNLEKIENVQLSENQKRNMRKIREMINYKLENFPNGKSEEATDLPEKAAKKYVGYKKNWHRKSKKMDGNVQNST